MDKGANLQNPYANVTIPRAQLKSSFIRDTLGEDLDGMVITNPSAVPTYPPYTPQEGFTNNNPNPVPPNGYRIHTQESWRRPYNPYAGDKPQNNGGPTNAMYPIELDKQYRDTSGAKEKSGGGGCGCCCCPCKCCSCCCPCCSCCKPCCVIS